MDVVVSIVAVVIAAGCLIAILMSDLSGERKNKDKKTNPDDA